MSQHEGFAEMEAVDQVLDELQRKVDEYLATGSASAAGHYYLNMFTEWIKEVRPG